MDLKYILKVFIVVFLIFSLIIFVNSFGLNLNDKSKPKKLLQVVTIEAMPSTIEGFVNLSTSILMNASQAFCEVHKGSSGSLDESCDRLTRGNCNDTSCCVWTSNQKCAAGGIDGPTFNTDTNGKTKQLDYYYFQGKCYGAICPTVA
jgi:hypothetical protein